LARYYDPATGQFLTVDPDVATTLSPYGYVQGNPLNSSDPAGLGPLGDLILASCTGPNAGKQCGGPGHLGQTNPNGGNVTPSDYVSGCASAVVFELCLSVTGTGKWYVSFGPGLGTPGVSLAIGSVSPAPASQLISGWSGHVGAGYYVGGGWAHNGVTAGGRCAVNGPYFSIGTPGAGAFYTWGWNIP
jgi:hypothetical protein